MSQQAAPALKPLRVIFAGTPEFARLALQSLHAAGADIVPSPRACAWTASTRWTPLRHARPWKRPTPM